MPLWDKSKRFEHIFTRVSSHAATLSNCGNPLRALLYRGAVVTQACSRRGSSPLDGKKQKRLGNPQPSRPYIYILCIRVEGSQTVREGVAHTLDEDACAASETVGPPRKGCSL